MKIKLILSPHFRNELKKLGKKYRSLDSDLEQFCIELIKNPVQGVLIRPNVRKVRMSIASKNKGKSAGARILTYFDVLVSFQESESEESYQKIYLFSIYDKSEQENLSPKDIENLIEQIEF